MIWFECEERWCVCSKSLCDSPFWQREGWVSVDNLGGKKRWEGEFGGLGVDSTRAWTEMWQLMLHLWHLSQTLVSDVTLFCSVEVIQKFSRSTKKWNSNVIWCWSTLSAAQSSSYKWKWLSPESQHVATDHEHQASRAAPSGQPHISNDSLLTTQSWPLAVLEYIIHC